MYIRTQRALAVGVSVKNCLNYAAGEVLVFIEEAENKREKENEIAEPRFNRGLF